jgi:hypothetical protein
MVVRMNKEQIRDKNIVLDLDEKEMTVLFTAFGYAGEDLIDQEGKDHRKQFYMAILQHNRQDFESLGMRLMSMFIAMRERV